LNDATPNLTHIEDSIASHRPRLAHKAKRRLLTIAHSYCVGLNRGLAHEMARVGADDWEVTAVAPEFFHGDLRPIRTEPISGELCKLEIVPAHLTARIHFFYYGLRLREILKRGFDLVHCWEEPYILAGGQIAWWTPRDTPLVFWTGQTISKTYPPPFPAIERYCIRRCAAWMTRGANGVEALLLRGYGAKPYCVMPLGIDSEHFFPDRAAGLEVRRQLGWTEDGFPVVGFSGRFVEEKGIRTMTRALERVRTPWRAMFVGGGPLEKYLKNWSERFPDRVRVVTGIEHERVPAYLNAMDVMCAPSQTTRSWREVFGRMAIEAFACGVPVIGSDSGEIPRVVGDAGVIIKEGDHAGLAAAIERVVTDSTLRSSLIARGLDRARSEYAWPVIAQRHLEFFETVLRSRESIRG
jgi:glycosyltransferase involved in cell wall biosynthesis